MVVSLRLTGESTSVAIIHTHVHTLVLKRIEIFIIRIAEKKTTEYLIIL